MLPQRAEEVRQRLAAAWHLAGDYDKSDQECQRFLTDYPKSAFKPAVQACRILPGALPLSAGVVGAIATFKQQKLGEL